MGKGHNNGIKVKIPEIIAVFLPLLLLDSEPSPVLALLDLQVLISLPSNLLASSLPALHTLPSSLQVEHRVLVTTPGRPLGRGGGEGDRLAGGGTLRQGGRGPSPALDKKLLLLIFCVDVNHSSALLKRCFLTDNNSLVFPTGKIGNKIKLFPPYHLTPNPEFV